MLTDKDKEIISYVTNNTGKLIAQTLSSFCN